MLYNYIILHEYEEKNQESALQHFSSTRICLKISRNTSNKKLTNSMKITWKPGKENPRKYQSKAEAAVPKSVSWQ